MSPLAQVTLLVVVAPFVVVALLAGRAAAGPTAAAPDVAAPDVAAPDLTRVTALAAAAEKAPVTPELARTFVDGLLAPGVGALPEACAAGLLAARRIADVSRAAPLYAQALRDLCPPTCAAALFASGQGDIVEVCDAAGPDPLFGSPALAGLRRDMDGMDYLLARMTLDPVLAAATGAPVGPRLDALRPTLARSLVMAGDELRSVTFEPPEVSGVDEVEVGFLVTPLQARVRACVHDARREGLEAAGSFDVVAYVDAVGRVIPAVDGPRALAPVLTCVNQAVRESERLAPPLGPELGRFSFGVTVTALPAR